MTHDLFRPGGPHQIRKVGRDQYSMKITLPTDSAGMISRACVQPDCSPAEFKIKCGTGLTEEHPETYCPYCRAAANPNDFATAEQNRYAKDIAMDEAGKGAERMIAKALGLDSRGKRKFGGGLISFEMSMKSKPRPPVRRPWEEQLRRDVTCPHCTLEHAVFGLAIWCPDCGRDIFLTHVETECQVVRAMLKDVDRRSRELGARVAARDIENGLEDVVSIMEASMKAITRRRLSIEGKDAEQAGDVMTKKVRNRFQSYDGIVDVLAQLFAFDSSRILDPSAVGDFKHTLEKRHPIAHNLGIVDRKYLEKVRSSEAEGRDVNLDEDEVVAALDTVITLVRGVHAGLFPTPHFATKSSLETGETE